MRRATLLALVVGLLVATALPARAGGADVDRAEDCWFPGLPDGTFEATDLRVQKVRTPAGVGQFHCHGSIDDTSQAPSRAVTIEGVCYLPVWFGWQPGAGMAAITPTGSINLTCHFGP